MIDAHHHFWHPARGDYGWMPPDDPVLSRPYAPADLADDLARIGVSQTILVQAAPSTEETEYLLGIADATPHVAKVVGWVDFEDPSQKATLERLSRHPKFVGVRPMIQDIADDDWMLRPELDWAFQTIIDLDLTFDCLGLPRHLGNFHQLLVRYDKMRAVLDHCLKPQFEQQDVFRAWADGMTALAEDTGACCKISGLVTEASQGWSDVVLRPYVNHVIEAFGPSRLMFGSDWPVCLLRCEYAAWTAQAKRLTSHLEEGAIAEIFSGTAR